MFQGERILVTNWVDPPKSSYCMDSWAQYVSLIPCPTGRVARFGETAMCWSQLTGPGGVSQLGTHSCGLEHSLQAATTQYNTWDVSMVKPCSEYRGKIVDDNQAVELEGARNHYRD